MSRYSRVSMRVREKKFVIDITFVFLFTIAILVNIVTLTTLQNDKGFLFDVSTLELILGLAGIGILVPLLGMGRLEFQMGTDWEETKKWISFGIIAFVASRLMLMFTSNLSTINENFSNNLSIVVSSAIFEEALFLPLALIVFITLSKTMITIFGKEMGNIMSVGATALFTGIMFAALHLGVYSDMTVLISLALARIIYTIIFLISRNFMSSTFAHVLHNVSIVMMVMG